MLSERIKELRNSFGWTQAQLAEKLKVSQQTIGSWEVGRAEPNADMIITLATLFEVSADYLLGNTDKKHYYDLTEKDERDIQKELQSMIDDLKQSGPISFSKDDAEMDEATKEALIISLENALRIAKIEAKKKFTPKKYRDE